MADQIVPQGVVGSPIRLNEPHPAAPSGEPGRLGQPHGGSHDGVHEFIEPGVTTGQSRRLAHTMRRDGVSAPIRTGDAVSAPVRAPDAVSAPVRAPDAVSAPVRAPDTASAPVRAPDTANAPARAPDTVSAPARTPDVASAPVRAPDAATAEPHDIITNRSSAPLDSTALYRKRTNPTLPTVSPDVIAGIQPVTDTPEVDAAVDAAIDAAIGRAPPPPSLDDAPPDLPSVVLDAPRSTGITMPTIRLPRPPIQLILSIIAAALVVIGLWMLRLAF